jgi:hypothetical protein
MQHEELIDSLRDQLSAGDRVVIANVGIGSRYLYSSIPIPDLMMFRKSYTKPDVTVFEIKAYKSDFGADVNEGKYRRYFDISNRVYFACRQGMIKKEDVPGDVGLYTYNEENKSWSCVKGAKRRECDLDRIEWFSILFALHDNQIRLRDLRERLVIGENINLEDIARNLPYQFANTIRNHREAMSELNKHEDELRRLVGMEVGGWWEIKNRIQELKEKACESDRQLVKLGFDLFKDALEGINSYNIDERIKQLNEYRDRIQQLKNKNESA